MKNQLHKRRSRTGYTLVEVAVATTILMIGVGAACALTLTMNSQEEAHVRNARATNLMENATRLYQLGLDTNTIFAILPPDPLVKTFSATAQTNPVMTGVGAPDHVSFTLNYHTSSDTTTWSPGTWSGRPDTIATGNPDYRTLGPIKVYRTSFRP